MTLLPILQRELRTAARRKSTYRIRSWTAVIAMVVSFIGFLYVLAMRGVANVGNPLFQVLSSYAFGLGLLAGVFLTSDCLSQERREGTLGLLFLADLRGYDVVLGKFMARSLNALYGLLALLPLTAIPVLMGGVTGGEVWRMSLALLNALFISLVTGVFVSSFVRDSQRALGDTLGLVLLLAGGLPALVALAGNLRLSPLWSSCALVSPFYPFSYALEARYATDPTKYWHTLFASQLLGWLFLALASRALERNWRRETIVAEPGGLLAKLTRRGSGSSVRRALLRARMLAANPVVWLIGDAPALRWLAWAIVGVYGLVAFTVMPSRVFSIYGAQFCGFLLKTIAAVQVCRFFAEGRRNGALELLACTPLRHGEVLRAQWLALWRLLLGPMMVLVLLNFIPRALALFPTTYGLPSRATDLFGLGAGLVAVGWYALRAFADICAVYWFGMCLALTLKNPANATALTILFVLVLPSVACDLVAPFCGPGVFADIFFIVWGLTKLRQDFRWFIGGQYESLPGGALRPAPPPVITTPPVIGR